VISGSNAEGLASPPSAAPLARRCASSLAFSAFFRASRSRLMSLRGRIPARVRRQEIVVAGNQAAQARVIALHAGVADHGRAQEDHQLRFLVYVLALLE